MFADGQVDLVVGLVELANLVLKIKNKISQNIF